MLIEYTYEGKEIVFSKHFAYIEYTYEGKEIVFSKYFCLYRISIRRKEIVFSQRTCFKTHTNQLEMHIIVHWVAPLCTPSPRARACARSSDLGAQIISVQLTNVLSVLDWLDDSPSPIS